MTSRMRGDLARRIHPTQTTKAASRRVRGAERHQVRREIAAEIAALKLVTVR